MKFHLLTFPDIVIVLTSFFAAYGVRQHWVALQSIQDMSFYIPFLIISVLTFIFVAFLFQLEQKDRKLLSLPYLVDFSKALFLWGALLAVFSFFSKTDYSRIVITLYFALAFFLLYLLRVGITLLYVYKENVTYDTELTNTIEQHIRLNLSAENLVFLERIRFERECGLGHQITKRFVDVIFALFGLVITLPLFPCIAVMIRRDSPGRVVVRQERIGRDGQAFTLYKFRTMYEDTALYAPAPRAEGDTRVTKVGKRLRQYSIDELPQLINVLLGHMSIVGPRPEMPFIVKKYNEWQRRRLSVRPGITGLWQILGRKNLPLEENLEYDLFYIYNQSFFLDLAIILRTIPHLLFPRGAY